MQHVLFKLKGKLQHNIKQSYIQYMYIQYSTVYIYIYIILYTAHLFNCFTA